MPDTLLGGTVSTPLPWRLGQRLVEAGMATTCLIAQASGGACPHPDKGSLSETRRIAIPLTVPIPHQVKRKCSQTDSASRHNEQPPSKPSYKTHPLSLSVAEAGNHAAERASADLHLGYRIIVAPRHLSLPPAPGVAVAGLRLTTKRKYGRNA